MIMPNYLIPGKWSLFSGGSEPVAGVCWSARERHDGRGWRPVAEPATGFDDPACEDDQLSPFEKAVRS